MEKPTFLPPWKKLRRLCSCLAEIPEGQSRSE